MIYPYRCKSCGSEFEVICRVAEYKRRVECKCGQMADRFFTPHQVMGADDWNKAEYNPGLGCIVKSRKHRAEIAKRKGLIEVGNEAPETIHKEHDKKRDDIAKKRWEEV